MLTQFWDWFLLRVWPDLFGSILMAVPALWWRNRRVIGRLRQYHEQIIEMLFGDDPPPPQLLDPPRRRWRRPH